jgi:spermidine synthase
MKKWTLLEQAATPDGSALTLHEHDGDYAIRVNGRELMSTRHHASEERLAEVACAHLKAASTRTAPRVLIGGLGLGFTLRAALAQLPPNAEVIVAELMPPVVDWNRNPAYGLAAAALADRRTQLEMVDVAVLIARNSGGFDAIMLDADNNTTSMNTAGNRRLYERDGLAVVKAALRPGGCVVYWSADSDPLFAKLLAKSGFVVEVEKTRAHATSGGLHTLLIGRRR